VNLSPDDSPIFARLLDDSDQRAVDQAQVLIVN
jgi:hypothetical protein